MKTLALSAATAALLALPLQAQSSQVTLSFTPQNPALGLADILVLEVAAQYDGTDLLLGGAFSLDFDASLLEVVQVTLRAPSDVAGTIGSVSVVGDQGTIEGVGFASFTGVSGSFALATIEFRALGVTGTSPLLAYDANDPIFNWVSESLQPITVNGYTGSVSVVPEPGVWALMLAGLGVVSLVASRGRREGGLA